MNDKTPVTKKYLDERLEGLKTELHSEIKNDLLEFKDEILSELQKIRDNFDAHQFSHQRINDDLADHDDRLVKLEKPTS
ncbi:MAG: hypothetical protein A2700_03090 [Candidatus Blackburnbacteria bacterium RIFCSPHIGHO2_01_FULL_44_64]|uniref:Uncharacterized protein n=2 Tax=Patescibacteria group TaxID=1783273 RepID=A0A0G1KEK6_9BACT|nr:MAG: hypothetical protein UW78_C0002G0017 [Candidatus Azambacteria bacterium GW2011_GWA1_44_9]OGY08319.1 MAG: hypothetical protein A2700_03090 [Candidatus Blackburnbacteria bacterium RIFCSPHIGHO2_01_FULL_44_64]OGY10370.1 MAG: hypothetical protein A3D26_03605 [Candidatus Blackburnbacteria bacterium RIFCSPHIGHO2_02_FULL_44_20]OGY12119.1 MAG: hypothetical protein A3E16_00175 [Candidatus Blackburnbacteria bacterium RIFCSPHIGHO2_12_FULL_44_25]OGY13736.1 MAG: hypothetical protein A3A62_02900 [Cand